VSVENAVIRNSQTAFSHDMIVAEIIHDTCLSVYHAGKAADVIIGARWGRRPRTYADHLATARIRQRGAGFANPLLSVTDEQLARADANIGWRLDLAGRAATKAMRDAEFGRAPFRLTAYGLERA
jgi:hypothetical protein